MNNSRALFALAVTFFAIGAVSADKPVPVDFATLDANSDGTLSQLEVQFYDDLKQSFEALDVNADDKLGPSEFAKWAGAGKSRDALPLSPATGPGGSAGAQHMPAPRK